MSLTIIIAYKKQKDKSKKREQFQLIKDNINLNESLNKIDFVETDDD